MDTRGNSGQRSHSVITLPPPDQLSKVTDGGSIVILSCSAAFHTSSLQPKRGVLQAAHTYTPLSEHLADVLIDAACGGTGGTVTDVLKFFRMTATKVPLFTSRNM